MDRNGPIAGSLLRLNDNYRLIVAPPDGSAYYGIRSSQLYRIDPAVSAATRMVISGGGITDMGAYAATYDTKRDRIIVSSLISEGHLMAYSRVANEWNLMAVLNGADLRAMVYRPADDILYGLRSGSGREFYKYSANGSLLGTLTLQKAIPFTQGTDSLDLQILMASDGQFAVIRPGYVPDPTGALTVPGVWLDLINPDTGAITYEGPLPITVPEPGIAGVLILAVIMLRQRANHVALT
ncbi:MAG TPA: hypothetical protein VGQ99_10660 [Tepidisphaeraceae bacterium]|jgi:hypothetical protein|nr:hypothetical protein [Tepidisphaeraceae bacterium]